MSKILAAALRFSSAFTLMASIVGLQASGAVADVLSFDAPTKKITFSDNQHIQAVKASYQKNKGQKSYIKFELLPKGQSPKEIRDNWDKINQEITSKFGKCIVDNPRIPNAEALSGTCPNKESESCQNDYWAVISIDFGVEYESPKPERNSQEPWRISARTRTNEVPKCFPAAKPAQSNTGGPSAAIQGVGGNERADWVAIIGNDTATPEQLSKVLRLFGKCDLIGRQLKCAPDTIEAIDKRRAPWAHILTYRDEGGEAWVGLSKVRFESPSNVEFFDVGASRLMGAGNDTPVSSYLPALIAADEEARNKQQQPILVSDHGMKWDLVHVRYSNGTVIVPLLPSSQSGAIGDGGPASGAAPRTAAHEERPKNLWIVDFGDVKKTMAELFTAPFLPTVWDYSVTGSGRVANISILQNQDAVEVIRSGLDPCYRDLVEVKKSEPSLNLKRVKVTPKRIKIAKLQPDISEDKVVSWALANGGSTFDLAVAICKGEVTTVDKHLIKSFKVKDGVIEIDPQVIHIALPEKPSAEDVAAFRQDQPELSSSPGSCQVKSTFVVREGAWKITGPTACEVINPTTPVTLRNYKLKSMASGNGQFQAIPKWTSYQLGLTVKNWAFGTSAAVAYSLPRDSARIGDNPLVPNKGETGRYSLRINVEEGGDPIAVAKDEISKIAVDQKVGYLAPLEALQKSGDRSLDVSLLWRGAKDRTLIVYYPLRYSVTYRAAIKAFLGDAAGANSVLALDRELRRFVQKVFETKLYAQIFIRFSDRSLREVVGGADLAQDLFRDEQDYEYDDYSWAEGILIGDHDDLVKPSSTRADILYFSHFRNWAAARNQFDVAPEFKSVFLVNFHSSPISPGADAGKGNIHIMNIALDKDKDDLGNVTGDALLRFVSSSK